VITGPRSQRQPVSSLLLSSSCSRLAYASGTAAAGSSVGGTVEAVRAEAASLLFHLLTPTAQGGLGWSLPGTSATALVALLHAAADGAHLLPRICTGRSTGHTSLYSAGWDAENLVGIVSCVTGMVRGSAAAAPAASGAQPPQQPGTTSSPAAQLVGAGAVSACVRLLQHPAPAVAVAVAGALSELSGTRVGWRALAAEASPLVAAVASKLSEPVARCGRGGYALCRWPGGGSRRHSYWCSCRCIRRARCCPNGWRLEPCACRHCCSASTSSQCTADT